MISLRNRIAILLITAIVTVVALATFAASRVLQPPLPEATIEPIARQIHLLISAASIDTTDTKSELSLRSGADGGTRVDDLSRFLMLALQKTGEAREAIVSENNDDPVLMASVRVDADSWLVTEMPDIRPPPGRWRVLIAWIGLIVIGSVMISLFATSKITRPLKLIESAVGRIGPDGVLAPIEETGPGELRATARALNRLSARLKSAMESRMRLVAAAGHDLRTPMTRMRLRAEFIPDDDERNKWLNDLEELDAIADSAIRLVREEASEDGQEDVRLDVLVHDVVSELQELGFKAITLSSVPVCVSAGPIALKRALRNLIINAATHGRGAKIKIAPADEQVAVWIQDDGPGIPEQLLGQVFEPFFRVDASRRKFLPGAGLGLAIAKEIIERFGGSISITNKSPSGLRQIIRFPRSDLQ